MSAFTQALRDLASSQKSRRGVSLYTRYVNRPIGRVLAAGCHAARMSPNQVTAASAVVTVLGLALLISGPPSLARSTGVVLLLVLGFALDSADGQVARLTKSGSPAGEWLDHVVDAGKHVSVHAAVLVTLYLHVSPEPWWYLAPLLFQVVAIVIFVGGLLTDLLKRSLSAPPAAEQREPSVVRAIALLPADYGVLALAFLFFAWPTVFLPLYALLLAANAVVMVLLLRKWFNELRRT